MDAIISICRSDFPSDQLCEEILRVLKPDGIILIHKTSQSVAVEKDEVITEQLVVFHIQSIDTDIDIVITFDIVLFFAAHFHGQKITFGRLS